MKILRRRSTGAISLIHIRISFPPMSSSGTVNKTLRGGADGCASSNCSAAAPIATAIGLRLIDLSGIMLFSIRSVKDHKIQRP